MADTKTTALTELAEAPAAGDLLMLVDVSDTTMDAAGTNKKITADNLKYSPPIVIEGDTFTIDPDVHLDRCVVVMTAEYPNTPQVTLPASADVPAAGYRIDVIHTDSNNTRIDLVHNGGTQSAFNNPLVLYYLGGNYWLAVGTSGGSVFQGFA